MGLDAAATGPEGLPFFHATGASRRRPETAWPARFFQVRAIVEVCDGCGSVVESVTTEVEDALCDLCLEIERYDRKARTDTDLATRLIQGSDGRSGAR
jgi:hypothetical protein